MLEMRWRCAEILTFQRHLEISAHFSAFSSFFAKGCAETALTSRLGLIFPNLGKIYGALQVLTIRPHANKFFRPLQDTWVVLR